MPTAAAALLWEIWRRHHVKIIAVITLTVAARLLAGVAGGRDETSVLIDLLAIVSVVLLLGIFNYTESGDERGLGGFPRRLFTLPVSSLTLVALPMLAGVVSVELMYLLWRDVMSRGGTTSTPFVALLLGALIVLYQCALWMFERLGTLRLVVIGAVVFGVFVVGLLPTLPPAPVPWWRTEPALALAVGALAVVAFLLAWRHVVRLRSGGQRSALQLEAIMSTAAAALPGTRRAFASPAAAHFWFEWRCSGLALPLLVGGQLLFLIGPYSWLARDDDGRTFALLLFTLGLPIVMAVPVGIAFCKPSFWSQDLALPAFLAVLPLTDEELVATKLKVAAASVLVSWLLVITFIGAWFALWGNLDDVSRFAIQLWAFHGQSVAAVYGIALLVVAAGMWLSWRLLVSRLWSGLAGSRALFNVSVISLVAVAIAVVVFSGERLPGWLLDDPGRVTPVVWGAAVAVIAKYWLAAYAWRQVSTKHARQYLLAWAAGTASVLAFGLVVLNVSSIYVAQDAYRMQALTILAALLTVPLARVGLAASFLARNRHR